MNGLTTPEAAARRAEALIAIAHPAFREELFEFAVRNHYLDRTTREPVLATG